MRFLTSGFWGSMMLISVFSVIPAYAACTSPDGVASSVDYDNATKTRRICDGTNWKLLEEIDDTNAGARTRLQIANDPQNCTTEKTGRLRFDGTSIWEYCNGVSWVPFDLAAMSRGYLIQSSATWNGNLGGLSGANAKCLSDVTNNDWRGKSTAGTITAGRVQAFLCDSSTCNNLRPNTTYMVSRSDDPIAGGMTFKTDDNGRGLNNKIYFDVDDKIWRANTYYWTNRGTVDAQTWASTAKSSASNHHCNNWSSTATNGHRGNSGYNDQGRWDSNTTSCNNAQFLICIVQPE